MRRGGWVLALLVAFGCGAEPEATAPVSAGPRVAALSRGSAVETSRVERGAVKARLTAAGTVHAHRTTQVGAIVPGRILQVYVEAGQRVEAGDPMFQIDPGPYQVAFLSAQAGLALARAELAQAVEQSARSSKLADQEMVSAQEHARSKTQATVARARVKQAEAQLAGAQLDLDRTLVRAPYAGSVVERRAHEGAMAMVTPGATVLVLQESDFLIASVDIPEASLANVRSGDVARLYVEGVGEPIQGMVMSVSDRIDAASRTYAVRIPVIDLEHRVKSGSFVRAEIDPSPREGSIVVDRSALVRREGRVYVFRVRDGLAERVAVRLGLVGDERAEVIEGVEPGDEVVVGDATERLQDGDRVDVQKAGQV